MAHKHSAILLDGVTTTGASSAVEALNYDRFSFFINAASVTTGGTVKIQTKSPNDDWVDLSETAVSADGDTLVEKSGAYAQVRANVTARTDGTYTVSMVARGAK
jgi:hypothetical protein